MCGTERRGYGHGGGLGWELTSVRERGEGGTYRARNCTHASKQCRENGCEQKRR